MNITLYLPDGTKVVKEMRPESEWEIDPVFLEGVGDDSKLREMIEEYFQSNPPPP